MNDVAAMMAAQAAAFDKPLQPINLAQAQAGDTHLVVSWQLGGVQQLRVHAACL